LLASPETSKVTPEQVGISTIPVSEAGKKSFSGLGGWNLLVNAASEDKLDEVWTFIEYMSSVIARVPENVRPGERLPTLKSLYEDEDVLKKVPVAALGKAALENARHRPNSPYYSDMSLVMAEHFKGQRAGGSGARGYGRRGAEHSGPGLERFAKRTAPSAIRGQLLFWVEADGAVFGSFSKSAAGDTQRYIYVLRCHRGRERRPRSADDEFRSPVGATPFS
jgi:hypothetical protein